MSQRASVITTSYQTRAVAASEEETTWYLQLVLVEGSWSLANGKKKCILNFLFYLMVKLSLQSIKTEHTACVKPKSQAIIAVTIIKLRDNQ